MKQLSCIFLTDSHRKALLSILSQACGQLFGFSTVINPRFQKSHCDVCRYRMYFRLKTDKMLVFLN